MADISAEIEAFQNAVYGEDVRDSMVSLANKLNNVVTTASTNANNSATKVNNFVDGFKNGIPLYELISMYDTNEYPRTNKGTTIVKNNDGSYDVSGTPSTDTFFNLVEILVEDSVVNKNGTFTVLFDTPLTNKILQCVMFFMDQNNTIITSRYYNGSSPLLIDHMPDNTYKIVVRIDVKTTFNGELTKIKTLKVYFGDEIFDSIIAGSMVSTRYGSDLDDYINTGHFLITDANVNNMIHLPLSTSGLLSVYKTNTICFQFYKTFTKPLLYYRTIRFNTTDNVKNVTQWISLNTIPYRTTNSSFDLNDIIDTSFVVLADNLEYANSPFGTTKRAAMLFTCRVHDNFVYQFAFNFSPPFTMYIRRCTINTNTWTAWGTFSGSEGEVINNYYTNEYHHNTYDASYNISATPVITTDSNNYLQSTNDTTDVTSSILTMLQSTGICNLGPGVFYIKNLVMPAGSTIAGCDASTNIILINDGDFAISMKNYCTIRNVTIKGSASTISRPTELGERHGILWSGNYSENNNSSAQPSCGIISDVRIYSFTGGGITCYNTGFGTFNHLQVINTIITSCGAGINVSYWSEFHKFTNVRCRDSLYGCINNGGNNVFVNCDFSTCTHGMLMDNSTNQSPNNSHGSAIGCVFNHTNNNTGIGINILNNKNGFIFDGCQIFFSQINIEESDGVVFSNCNLGNVNTDITINGGGLILFTNNVHQAKPPISIVNNNNVHFINCYTRSDGTLVEP